MDAFDAAVTPPLTAVPSHQAVLMLLAGQTGSCPGSVWTGDYFILSQIFIRELHVLGQA